MSREPAEDLLARHLRAAHREGERHLAASSEEAFLQRVEASILAERRQARVRKFVGVALLAATILAYLLWPGRKAPKPDARRECGAQAALSQDATNARPIGVVPHDAGAPRDAAVIADAPGGDAVGPLDGVAPIDGAVHAADASRRPAPPRPARLVPEIDRRLEAIDLIRASGDYERVAAMCRALLDRFPRQREVAPAALWLGQAERRLGRPIEAAGAFERAARLAPGSALAEDALRQRASVLRSAGTLHPPRSPR